MNLLKWISKAIRGAAVKRFHTVPTIGEQTVGTHSFGVAMMVLAITEQKAGADLLRAALFHDMAEQVTGDSPFTAKKAFPLLKSTLEVVEEDWNQKEYFHVDLSNRDKIVLKWADMLELLWYCKVQRDLGNTNMDRVFNNGCNFLNTLEPIGKGPEILGWLCHHYKGDTHGIGSRHEECGCDSGRREPLQDFKSSSAALEPRY